MIPVSYLKECFIVNDEGRLVWRVRPLHHFVSTGSCSSFNKLFAGKLAGRINFTGYYAVNLTMNRVSRKVLAHRILWAMHHGEWPKQVIDHINHVRTDNRMVNLRDVSNAENLLHKKLARPNPSGTTGVICKRGKFVARIGANNKLHYLGSFSTLEAARAAYQKAFVELRGAQA